MHGEIARNAGRESNLETTGLAMPSSILIPMFPAVAVDEGFTGLD